MSNNLRGVEALALILALSLALTASPMFSPTINASSIPERKALRNELIQLYTETVNLSREGVNVSGVVNDLSSALALIDEGSNESLIKASQILSNASKEINALRAEAPRIKLMNDLRLYGTVAVLASIPILTYFLLPRAYLIMWFRSRRRWLVRHEHT